MDEELEEEYQRQLNKTICPDVIELKLQVRLSPFV